VGHSLGGANVRAFAHLFKDEIAGLVFIDPFNETVFTSAAKEQQEAAVTQQTEALRDAPAAAQSEFKYLGDEVRKGFPEMKSFGVPPDVPMMVIVAGTDRPPRWVESVMSLYGPWAAAAKEGRLLLLPDSSHFVQGDEPGIVIESIRRVVFPSVRNRLEQTIKTQGVPAAVALYREMRSRYPAEYFRERTLNVLGYQQLNNKHVAEAIELFKLNVEMYPRASNPYDSLGEAYMVHGDRALAIKNYRLSLKLNPKNTGAIDALRKLQSAP
jgi:tetratricopeptide (TPR) repeat protein